jgi:hypothetical protein
LVGFVLGLLEGDFVGTVGDDGDDLMGASVGPVEGVEDGS